ncbi:MAG TPA: hypothetical protein VEC36_10640 [Patescibacteria group bacterium]|nr:hypothetical protein [Patescibacteria group bacterium]
MKDFEHHAFSDLIYLFIDGEADDTQKSALFAALANDTSLQAEFQSAMKFHTSYPRLTSEDAMPPAILSCNLFEKAGFNPALAVPLATAVVAGTVRSGLLSSIGTKILAFKSVLIPLATALIGIVATAGLMNDNSQEIKLSEAQKPETNSAAEVFKNSGETGDYHFQNGNEVNFQKSIATPVFKKKNKVLRTDNDLQPEILAENPVLKDFSSEKKVSENADISLLKNSEHTFKTSQTGNKTIIFQPILIIDTVENKVEENVTSYVIYTRKLGTVALFPTREPGFGGYKFLDNTSLGAMYSMDENHGIVLEAGEEVFPVFVKNESGEYTFTNTLQWVTAGYRLTASPLTMLGGIQPYTQLNAGYVLSGSGPVAKGLAGIQWQPFKNVTFSGGLETTALFYKRENTQKVGGKVGYFYGLSILF